MRHAAAEIIARRRRCTTAAVRCGRQPRPPTSEHLVDAQHPAGIVQESKSGLPLEPIDVRYVRHHYIPLIDHHAAREQPKEYGLDDESHQVEDVAGLVQTMSTGQPAVAQATNEPADDEGEGIRAGQKGVEYEQQKVLMIANADAVVHPRAVMVHLDDAALAHRAVMGAAGLVGVAPAADALPAGGRGLLGGWWMRCLLLCRLFGVVVGKGCRHGGSCYQGRCCRHGGRPTNHRSSGRKCCTCRRARVVLCN
mmetsp:Transcript_32668/g.96286  ORF Transcript_32668/g.96286 Transcript_32668/m.96286 type:complete len:252 (+) Transcript_32668:119-874(+)